MPLQWQISHPARLVSVVANGSVQLADLEPYFAALRTEGALPYRKLIDARSATPALSSEDFSFLFRGLLLRYSAHAPLGPVAWIAENDSQLPKTFSERMALPLRPFRTFVDIDEARLWLTRMPIEI
ncbi:hypothetical protein [Reyranella sp.]|jgi:hypothetical protein|uniref:hypothetical protein n=1 Tax=Reyranella sp. TaxID=1929291 RepID=UPI002F94242A